MASDQVLSMIAVPSRRYEDGAWIIVALSPFYGVWFIFRKYKLNVHFTF